MDGIEEAQRLRKEADERALTAKMTKRLVQAIKNRNLQELEEIISEVKKKKVGSNYLIISEIWEV